MKSRPSDEGGPTLLSTAVGKGRLGQKTPLADRMRPTHLEEVVGQDHLLRPGQPLAEALSRDRLVSMILWGPPGCGKTSIARLVSRTTRSEFVAFSAVLGGLPELRTLLREAKERRQFQGRSTVLFVDEIHRFNKGQQDAFLPHVEAGIITLIGATTENPSFSINAAVLSRCRVFRLKPLDADSLVKLLERTLADAVEGLGGRSLVVEKDVLRTIATAAQGDARRALALLESASELIEGDASRAIDQEVLKRAADEPTFLFDRNGDQHYDVISVFIKSLRGSDPDAAVYWLMRLLESGADPLFVLRRMVIFSSEDIGNADPRALGIVMDADHAFRRLGMPEGIYPMAQACLYLACAPKSNATKLAWLAAQKDVRQRGALPVPERFRNPVTAVMQSEGYGAGYRYPHDYPGHYVADETYLPAALAGTTYYLPSDQGVERQILDRLARLRGTKSPAGGEGS